MTEEEIEVALWIHLHAEGLGICLECYGEGCDECDNGWVSDDDDS